MLTRCIEERQPNGVMVIRFAGRVTVGEGAARFRKKMLELIVERNHRKVLVDMAEVSYCDSSGIQELLSAVMTMRQSNGAIKFINFTKKVLELLDVTKLRTAFDIQNGEETGIASFI